MACCCRDKPWPDEAKVLFVTTALFLSFTTIQFFAALVAQSTALLVDCASMQGASLRNVRPCRLVDALTYAVNLWAVFAGEDDPEGGAQSRYSLFSAGLSLFVLYAITGWGLADATVDLFGQDSIDDDLDPWIVLGFGIGGLVFDCFAVGAFKFWGGDSSKLSDGYTAAVTDETRDDAIESESLIETAAAQEATRVNMFSALTHVVADGVRSVTSIMLGALVLMDPKLNGSQCDDYATLVVAATILVGSLPLAMEWRQLKQSQSHFPDIADISSMRFKRQSISSSFPEDIAQRNMSNASSAAIELVESTQRLIEHSDRNHGSFSHIPSPPSALKRRS